MGRRARRATPRVAVLYEDSFNYLTKMCLLRMRQAALVMIDAARARGVPVIVAGSDASDHPALYLERGADVVVDRRRRGHARRSPRRPDRPSRAGRCRRLPASVCATRTAAS